MVRHKSIDMLSGYVRDADEFVDHAGAKFRHGNKQIIILITAYRGPGPLQARYG